MEAPKTRIMTLTRDEIIRQRSIVPLDLNATHSPLEVLKSSPLA
jgi:hypothetical protein